VLTIARDATNKAWSLGISGICHHWAISVYSVMSSAGESSSNFAMATAR
jgi:hypothetical protein